VTVVVGDRSVVGPQLEELPFPIEIRDVNGNA